MGDEKVRLLRGSVHFRQDAMMIYCDSALFFHDRNFVEAYHHVKIVHGADTIRSRRLRYNGVTRQASFYGDVRYSGDGNTLRTEQLDYLVSDKVAYYKDNGLLIDSLNTLRSREGYYYAAQQEAIFRKQVLLTHPEYTLKTEALVYNMASRVATLRAKGVIDTRDGVRVYAAGGTVDTQQETARLRSAVMINATHVLAADQLLMDRKRDYHQARKNVSLEIVQHSVTFFGEYGEHHPSGECSVLYGSPFMQKVLKNDTLYVRADNFLLREKGGKRHIYAYPRAELHSKNSVGKANFVVYVPADSLLFAREDPVFWSGDRQITAESLTITLTEDHIHTMLFEDDAFIMSKNDVGYFDQAKSTTMLAYFSQGELREIEADGNSTSLYFVTEDDGLLTGMNVLTCGKMRMLVRDDQVENMRFYLSPKGTFYPPSHITEDNRCLPGAAWRAAERPESGRFYEKVRLKQQIYEAYDITPRKQ